LLAARFAREGRRHPRAVPLEPAFATLLPEVLLGVGPTEFAVLAGRAMTPRPRPNVAVDHLHAPRVSVREQAVVLAARLRESGAATFRGLTADAGATLVVVARFLALLELYREGAVVFEQLTPLGELHVRWVGAADAEAELERWAHETGEHDEYDAVVDVDAAGGRGHDAGTEDA
jgi:segregation and condensation protein A